MSAVRIAELEAHLADHLRSVREGESVTVLDEDTPIARLVPYVPEEIAQLPPTRPEMRRLRDIPLPPPLPLEIDIVEFLLEERSSLTPLATDRLSR